MESIVQGFHWELPSEYIYKCYIWKNALTWIKKKKIFGQKRFPTPECLSEISCAFTANAHSLLTKHI